MAFESLTSDGYTLYYFTLLSASSGCKREIQRGYGGFDEWRCALEPIFPGQTRTFTATIRANTAGAYPYTMRVSSAAGDRATQPSSATTLSTTTPPPPPPPPPPPDRPATPPNFEATVTEGNRVMLAWGVALRATSYRLEYRDNTLGDNPAFALLNNFYTEYGNANSYDASYVNFPAVYEYRLTAINSSGESDPTLTSATTAAYEAPVPTLAVAFVNPPLIVALGVPFTIQVRITNPAANLGTATDFNGCYSSDTFDIQSLKITNPNGTITTITDPTSCLPNLATVLQAGESLMATWTVTASSENASANLYMNAWAKVSNLRGWSYGQGDTPLLQFQIVPSIISNPALALSFEAGYISSITEQQTIFFAVSVFNSGSIAALGTEVCLSSDQDVGLASEARTYNSGGNGLSPVNNGCVTFDATAGQNSVVFELTGITHSEAAGTISASVYHPADATPDDNNTSGSFWVTP